MDHDKTRILQVISGLDIGGGHGGAERFGLELARALDPDLFEVSVCAFWRRNTESESYWLNVLKSDGIPVFFNSDWMGKFNTRAYARGVAVLIRKIKEEGFELLHSHFQMGTLASLITKAFTKVKVVIRTAHITLEWGEGVVAWLMRRSFTDWIFPITLQAEVGVSQAVLDQLESHPGARVQRSKTILIHNAINTEFPNDRELEEQQIGYRKRADEILIGSIGRLTRQKGYRYLLHALQIVLDELPNLKLILIGEGDLTNELKNLAIELGIDEQVDFLGQINNVRPVLDQLDLFVLPSLWEGFPTVILESMAHGIPVIATNIPGSTELVKDQITGWLVEPKSPNQLAQKIYTAITDSSKRDEIVANALDEVRNYDIVKIAEKYERTYIEILKRDL